MQTHRSPPPIFSNLLSDRNLLRPEGSLSGAKPCLRRPHISSVAGIGAGRLARQRPTIPFAKLPFEFGVWQKSAGDAEEGFGQARHRALRGLDLVNLGLQAT